MASQIESYGLIDNTLQDWNIAHLSSTSLFVSRHVDGGICRSRLIDATPTQINPPLEKIFQRELHDSRVICRSELAEISAAEIRNQAIGSAQGAIGS